MRFESTIMTRRNTDEVCRFFAEPLNIPKWDRGVATVEWPTEANPPGIGFEFTTVGHPGSGPDRGRMTYRVVAADPQGRDTRTALISRSGNARFVRAAEWRQIVEDSPQGSRVTLSTEFRLRFRYLPLGLVLCIAGKSALHKDMVNLKNVLENG